MTSSRVEPILTELGLLHDQVDDPQLAAVRLAILVEDAFAITLSDRDIDPDLLCDASALRDLLTARTASGAHPAS